ncbi:putative angiopoietin-related protein 2-like [Sesbania bispinosa]|nr:putative angiopoietin-related protein 2-like [Sesbania bispinosa]
MMNQDVVIGRREEACAQPARKVPKPKEPPDDGLKEQSPMVMLVDATQENESVVVCKNADSS